MRNMLCLPWTSVGLSKRVLFLAFVAGAALMSASTSSLAQQHDHSRQIKSAGVSATFTAWLKGEDISREKFEEIGLQFIFVVVFGGLLTARIARLRDNATRKDSELSSLRDLIKQVDELYRSTKQSKRMIRSRLRQIADGYEVDAVFFAARLDAARGRRQAPVSRRERPEGRVPVPGRRTRRRPPRISGRGEREGQSRRREFEAAH